jgi:tetratricopeptide (TPR) repeat protein
LTRTPKSENLVNPYIYHRVAIGLWRVGEYKSAITLLKKADVLCKSTAYANYNLFALEDDLAWCYFNCQMWSNAEELYRKLLNMQVPDIDHRRYISANDRLAECCKQLGKKEEAISFARKAVALSEKEEKPAAIPDSYLILADNFEKLGQREKAKVFIERAINSGNETGSALVATRTALEAAKFYSKVGNYNKARDVLRNALGFVELLKGDKTPLQNALSMNAKS